MGVLKTTGKFISNFDKKMLSKKKDNDSVSPGDHMAAGTACGAVVGATTSVANAVCKTTTKQNVDKVCSACGRSKKNLGESLVHNIGVGSVVGSGVGAARAVLVITMKAAKETRDVVAQAYPVRSLPDQNLSMSDNDIHIHQPLPVFPRKKLGT